MLTAWVYDCNMAVEQITDKGYGNGVSMIILPRKLNSEMIQNIYVDYFVNIQKAIQLNSYAIFNRYF